MKIAMFTNTYAPHVGGVARSIQSCEDALRARGNEVHVIAPEFTEAQESTEFVLRVPAIQNFNGSDFSVGLPQPWIISDHIDLIQPELIHSHHPFLLGDSALRTAYERRLPLVFTHHTMYERYSHYVPLDSDAMKRIAVQLATEYCNLCDHVIAPSQSIETLLRKRGVTSPITTIPTGIDLEFFRAGDRQRGRDRLQIPQDAIVIGHVGRLAPEKNLEFLASAVALWLADHPEARFLVVGGGPSRESMQNILAEHVPPTQIVFAGQQSGQDLADAYAAMDVFAFASQSETQGMVIAEALAAGNPVVALDGPGVREVLNGQNGILLESDASHNDFAAALVRMSDESRRSEAHRESVRETVKDFSLQCCIDRLSDVYGSLIEEFDSQGGHQLGSWDQLIGRLDAEWKLAAEKASALTAAVADTDATRAVLT